MGQPEFPMVNISVKQWNADDSLEYVLYDEFCYTTNQQYINPFLLQPRFCDARGNIYQVVRIIEPQSRWRHMFKFLPYVYKCTLQFRLLDETISVEALKTYLVKGINSLDYMADSEANIKFQKEWTQGIQKADTFRKVLNALTGL